MAIDTRTLLQLVDSIYDAGLGVGSWHAVVAAVARSFGEQGGILYEFDARQQQSLVLGAIPIDPRMLAEYEQYYAGIDDWNRRILREPTLEANATHNLVLDAEFERTEFCNDYLRQLDFFYAMGGIVRRQGSRTTVLGVQRSRRRGHYDKSDFKAMAFLVRHVDRSLLIAERLHQATAPPRDEADRGVVLLAHGGKVAFATEPTLRLMAEAGITLRDGRLSAANPGGAWLEELLDRLDAAARAGRNAGHALDVPLADGARLSLLALGGAANAVDGAGGVGCLMIERHQPPPDATTLLRQRHRLTQAEAALAVALAEGRALRDIARTRGVSVNTLRVQLQAVFDKTGCHRQGELVRLVLGLPRA